MSCDKQGQAVLVIVQGDEANFPKVINLESNKVSIGRAQKCNITLGSSQISREHATFEYFAFKWFIRDTSTNGLSVNGSKLVKGKLFELEVGDQICFLPTGAPRYWFRNMPATGSSSSTISTQPSASRTATPSSSGPTTLANTIVDSLESSSSSSPFHNDNNNPSVAENNNSNHRESLLSLGNGEDVSYSCSESESEDESPNSSISKRNHASDSPDRDDQKIMMSEDQMNKCDDLKTLKLQLKSCQAKLGSTEVKLKKLEIERNMERQDFGRKENELKSVNAVFKEETGKKILELLESELSCGMCTEVFIQATVVDCGHTFCSFCINKWSRTKHECPICRKPFRNRSPHIEMENYISRLFDSFTSPEIAARRKASVKDREKQAKKAGGDAARAATRENQNRGGAARAATRENQNRGGAARAATRENQNRGGGNFRAYLLLLVDERYLRMGEQIIRNLRANETGDRRRSAGILARLVDGALVGQAQPGGGRGGNNRNATGTGNEAHNNGTGGRVAVVVPPPIPPRGQPTMSRRVYFHLLVLIIICYCLFKYYSSKY